MLIMIVLSKYLTAKEDKRKSEDRDEQDEDGGRYGN